MTGADLPCPYLYNIKQLTYIQRFVAQSFTLYLHYWHLKEHSHFALWSILSFNLCEWECTVWHFNATPPISYKSCGILNSYSGVQSCRTWGCIMAHVSSYCFMTVEVQTWSQASLYGICGGQTGSGTCFLRVLQFSPTSIIPQMLHTHISFIYTTDAVADDSVIKTSLFSSIWHHAVW